MHIEHQPARAEAEEALTARALSYLARIEARCVELSDECRRAIEICRRLEAGKDERE